MSAKRRGQRPFATAAVLLLYGKEPSCRQKDTRNATNDRTWAQRARVDRRDPVAYNGDNHRAIAALEMEIEEEMVVATITAIYENGVLRPVRPLPLREHQMVQLQLVVPENETEEALRLLIQAGIVTPPSLQSNNAAFSAEERRRLAEVMSKASDRSLAELILEERSES
jgi:predicted DNA-binding antitoxin AbrB/MazE fold protein